MIWFFLSLVAFLYFFAHSLVMEKIEFTFYWNKGFIPPWKKKSEDTYLYIYIALAALLLPAKQEVSRYPKLAVLYKFIVENKRGRLPMSERSSYYSKLRNMLTYALAHPIQPDEVQKWADQRKLSEGKRLQIIRFLSDFAYTTEIDARKLKMLQKIADSFSISEKQLAQVIELTKEAEKQARQEQQHKGKTGKHTGEYVKCCALLGVKTNASMNEIKKAYRKLVHQYHPDRFENSDAKEYKSMQQKFIEIQHAYEKLEKMMSGK